MKWRTGSPLDVAWGNARDIQATELGPRTGLLVLTNEGPGHVAYVEFANGRYIEVSETNYATCAFTRRTLSVDDPLIRGYTER